MNGETIIGNSNPESNYNRISVMVIRYLMFFMLLVCCITGCMEQSSEVVLPEKRSLGQEIRTYQSPKMPIEAPEVFEISEPTGDINLRQALALALMYNPELRAFSWDVRVSEAKQLKASLWPNPTLEVEVEEAGGAGERSDFDGAETSIGLSQLIELGDKRNKRTKLALLERELAGWDYEAKRLDVFTEVTKAFSKVLAAQQRLGLTKELLQVSKELVDTVGNRVDAGKDSPLEKTKAVVAFSDIKIQHQQAIENLHFTRKQLVATWAGEEVKFENVTGKLDSLTPVPSVDELKDMIEDNPDIARWAMEINKNKAALELEKAKSVSDITLSGGLQRFQETDDNAIMFGISIPLPISDKNQAGKLQAKYELVKAREEQRAAYTKVQVELDKAYQALSSAYIEATELEKNVLPGAEGVFEASKTGYTRGKLDYLNVLDAQRTLFEAKARYIDALASYHDSKADIERLIGKKLDSVNNFLGTKSGEGE
jgi:cobalt-zinc-cadmium efflux system outer membrane protein